MPITRAKATALLNQREMTLYDESRANALRALDAKALASCIRRARDARDRARDLVRRQKLSSRDRTGTKRGSSGLANQRSKDKAELTADILRRFEAQLPVAQRREVAAAKAKGQAKATRTPATARKASTVAKAGKATAARKATPPASSARKPAAKHATGKAARTKKATAKRALSPRQALKRTRELLEAKQARDREPKPWETLGGTPPTAGQPGYQSGSAARRARELHAAETRLPAIMGSISTRDRINQGKRDHRGGGED